MKLKYRKKIHKNREEFFWLARIYTPMMDRYGHMHMLFINTRSL